MWETTPAKAGQGSSRRIQATTTTIDLDRWCQFHQEVEKLPAREREVVGLIYYHGWTQAQVAELFQVNVRTVRRWWESALVELHRVLKSEDGEDSQS